MRAGTGPITQMYTSSQLDARTAVDYLELGVAQLRLSQDAQQTPTGY
jgi:hypothetical protein